MRTRARRHALHLARPSEALARLAHPEVKVDDSTKIEFSRSAIASVEKSEEELKAIEEAKKAEAEAKKAKKAKKNDADADAKEEKTEVSVETPSEENTETK